MQRRKFLIGAAGTAIGGSALVGSGAFNIARADRDMTVDTVGDSDAYLGLEETDGEYAEIDTGGEGTLAIDFGENTNDGQGLGENSNYVFTDVFKIVNQGTDDIAVTLSEELNGITWDTTYPRAYYSFGEIGTTNDVNGDGDFTGGTAADGAVLGTGDELYVHFEFVGREAELGGDSRGTDTEVPETVGVYAEATDSS